MTAFPKPTFSAEAVSPYRAIGPVVWKLSSSVEYRSDTLCFLEHPLCTVSADVEDPSATAAMIAEALNALALLQATDTPGGEQAVTYWLNAYLSGATVGAIHSDEWLANHRDAQLRAAQLVAKHGLIGLILEASRLVAGSRLAPLHQNGFART